MVKITQQHFLYCHITSDAHAFLISHPKRSRGKGKKISFIEHLLHALGFSTTWYLVYHQAWLDWLCKRGFGKLTGIETSLDQMDVERDKKVGKGSCPTEDSVDSMSRKGSGRMGNIEWNSLRSSTVQCVM